MNIPDPTYKNRMVLLLIAGIPVTVMLIATWLWFFVARGDLDLVSVLGTANRGILVQPPRQLDGIILHDQAGEVVHYDDPKHRWTLLVAASGSQCDALCEHNLYLTRQIHAALGKEFNRIRRLYVSDVAAVDTQLLISKLSDKSPAPASFAALLQNSHPDLEALVAEPGGYDRLFAEHSLDPSTWYLVDPAGWVMMSYNAGISYKDVISDLKFLLKNSSE